MRQRVVLVFAALVTASKNAESDRFVTGSMGEFFCVVVERPVLIVLFKNLPIHNQRLLSKVNSRVRQLTTTKLKRVLSIRPVVLNVDSHSARATFQFMPLL